MLDAISMMGGGLLAPNPYFAGREAHMFNNAEQMLTSQWKQVYTYLN